MRKLRSDEKEAWDDFVFKNDSGHIFATTIWLDSVCSAPLVYEIYVEEENDKIVAGMPLVFDKRYSFLRVLTQPPLTPHLGIIVDIPHDSGTVKKNSKLRKVIESCAALIDELNCDYINFPFQPEISDMIPFKKKQINISTNYTYRIDLHKEEQEIYAGLAQDKKRNIKTGLKDGLKVKSTTVEVLIGMMKNTFNRQGSLPPWLNIARELYLKLEYIGRANSFGAMQNEKPLAAIQLIWDNSKAFYMGGGYDEKADNYSAGPMAMWEAIKFAKQKKLKIFDFEGSEIEPVENYVRRFGGELIPYFCLQFKSRKYRIFETMYIRLRAKLKI